MQFKRNSREHATGPDAAFIRNPDKLLLASCRAWLCCNQMRQGRCNILVNTNGLVDALAGETSVASRRHD